MDQSQLSSALGVPLLVGVLTIVCTVALHGAAGAGVVHLAQNAVQRGFAGAHFGRNVMVLSAAMLVALVAHLIQIAIWALVFELCGEFSGFRGAFYHSAVNYTTLGYGDYVMSPPWRLLGPIEAADGMLMFAFSAAIVVAVIQRVIQPRLDGISPTSIG
jgi:Ion channel